VGLVQVPLDGGGTLLVRLPDDAGGVNAVLPGPVTRSGPVRAGRLQERVEDVVAEASVTLRDALEPLTQMSRQVLEQLAESQPDEITVDFGIELTAEAGAVLTKAGVGCHFAVSLKWKRAEEPKPGDG
jgi:hypothetical protein